MSPPILGIASGSSLLARLTPMKRILCLCPVSCGSFQSDYVEYHVGMAVSDPYLARASPVRLDKTWKVQWPVKSSLDPKDAFPSNLANWRDQLDEYPDIGAIALAFPMKDEVPTTKNETILRDVRGYIGHQILHDRYLCEDGSFAGSGLLGEIDDRLSGKEVQHMALEDPEMWEEMDLGDPQLPSTHAYVALNHFLWQHTGGWQNTFG